MLGGHSRHAPPHRRRARTNTPARSVRREERIALGRLARGARAFEESGRPSPERAPSSHGVRDAARGRERPPRGDAAPRAPSPRRDARRDEASSTRWSRGASPECPARRTPFAPRDETTTCFSPRGSPGVQRPPRWQRHLAPADPRRIRLSRRHSPPSILARRAFAPRPSPDLAPPRPASRASPDHPRGAAGRWVFRGNHGRRGGPPRASQGVRGHLRRVRRRSVCQRFGPHSREENPHGQGGRRGRARPPPAPPRASARLAAPRSTCEISYRAR